MSKSKELIAAAAVLFLSIFNCYKIFLKKNRDNRMDPDRLAQLPSRILGLSTVAEVNILTPRHTTFVAALVRHSLSKIGVRAAIIHEKPPSGYSNQPYIVIAPQIFDELPKTFIAYQMEQSISDRWFDERYINILKRAAAIFDYSIANIEFLRSKGLPVAKIYHMPLSILPDMPAPSPSDQSDGPDVLFYGDPHVERRRRILERLQEQFKVEVVSEIYGEELYEKIKKAKIVVNIHYYDDALLETTRLHECLSLKKLVVSERGSDQSAYPGLDSLVDFVEVGNIEQMISTITKRLNNPHEAEKRMTDIDKMSGNWPTEFAYYFFRFLLASDEINFDKFYSIASSYVSILSNNICLGLPEYQERQQRFMQEAPAEFQMFCGLRHRIAWVGCGLSYKFIMKKALEQKLPSVTICEDDVEFPPGAAERFGTILQYLSHVDDWDIFAGLIADLHDDTQIEKVEQVGDMKLVYLDRMVSMVFNVYSSRVFSKFLEWNSDFRDLEKNTIDRFIEGRGDLRIVSSQPFLVGHREELNSTLWSFSNTEYRSMIDESTRKLDRKLSLFGSSSAP